MKVLTLRRWAELDAAERNRILERATSQILDPKLLESIGRIYADVAARGDAAVADATERFDGVRVDPNALLVDQAALDAAHAALPPALLDAIRFAIASVRAFNEAQLAASPDWRREIRPGVEVGERMRPIPSAGLFVPCGKGSYPSVLVMIGTPAVVAGVPELTVVVPPMPGTDRVDPGVLATAKELGIRRVLRANGPAGVAAVALGTATIPRVAKIVGPGSPAVTAAQVLAQIHGVATNMLCGPSESLIIADDSIDPVRLAADLLNEAEHGADSAALLVRPSRTNRGGTARLVPLAQRRAERKAGRHPRRRSDRRAPGSRDPGSDRGPARGADSWAGGGRPQDHRSLGRRTRRLACWR